MDVPQHLVRPILAEVDPGPAGDQRQGPFVADEGAVFVELGPGLGVGFAQHHRLQVEHQYLARIAAGLGDALADVGDRLLEHGLRWRGDEHALGVLGGEALATTRRAGLVEHRRALRRRFAEMDAGYLEVLADMADLVNLAWVAEDPSATVAEHRAVLPTAFEELVEHL